MKNSDKRKRAIVFYFSVFLFLILFPIILSYSLGYKIDFKKLKVYKTGILYINSRPTGASIYINGKLHTDLTPAQIEEMKPGIYKIEVKREGFYSWERNLVVMPKMVTRADRIVLFPVIKDMKKISECDASEFVVSNKNYIYYLTKSGLFRSAMDGANFRKISSYSNWPEKIIGKRFSPPNDSFLFFTENTLYVAYLNSDVALMRTGEQVMVEELIKSPDPILDAFWYSDAGYIIMVTTKSVEVLELRGDKMRNIVSLYKFAKTPKHLYYDEVNDSLYFTDTPEGSASGNGTYLYRLNLRQKFFDKFMKLLKEVGTTNEEK